ncbi:hypothetical protein SO802_021542 [Lithocarpus litseifolius]|uniref:Uncharacterized protein n=1 Tax=Lithocarpus litseifolius TaxID=425828 RepID=A0AAW2CF64_9ROSI
MDFESVRRYLEKGGNEDEDKNASTINGLPLRFFERFIMQDLRVNVIEPSRLILYLQSPTTFTVTTTLVDLVGSAVIFSVGAPATGVSVEINVSYLDAAYADHLRLPKSSDLQEASEVTPILIFYTLIGVRTSGLVIALIDDSSEEEEEEMALNRRKGLKDFLADKAKGSTQKDTKGS